MSTQLLLSGYRTVIRRWIGRPTQLHRHAASRYGGARLDAQAPPTPPPRNLAVAATTQGLSQCPSPSSRPRSAGTHREHS